MQEENGQIHLQQHSSVRKVQLRFPDLDTNSQQLLNEFY